MAVSQSPVHHRRPQPSCLFKSPPDCSSTRHSGYGTRFPPLYFNGHPPYPPYLPSTPFPSGPSTPTHFTPSHTPTGTDSYGVLGDVTGSTVNANGKRSRTASTRGSAARGRGRGSAKRGRGGPPARILTTDDFPLIGPNAPVGTATGPPSFLDPTLHPPRPPAPLHEFQSILKQPDPDSSKAPATDVWWSVYLIETENGDPPDCDLPRIRAQPHSRLKPDSKVYPRVACRFCRDSQIPEDACWQIWSCVNGQTAMMRDHFRAHHHEEWRAAVIKNQLKGWAQLAYKQQPSLMHEGLPAQPPEPYSRHGLESRLGDLIAADDQAIQVIESEWFQKVIIYASTSPRPLTDADIPHRTQMHNVLIRKYETEIRRIREELQCWPLSRPL
ncbi:hypothetical protein BN946_scf185042.g168 [Trametes cinnabarina]|uniref:Uncharacterized protein n=1 Tax=Pycnoporus cinnabarinus TaxID=5643 RepID=A0A060S516_PYCCI|nr:hypothetical protein BN946_scf185042.g168 [Trametes cinnabarina]